MWGETDQGRVTICRLRNWERSKCGATIPCGLQQRKTSKRLQPLSREATINQAATSEMSAHALGGFPSLEFSLLLLLCMCVWVSNWVQPLTPRHSYLRTAFRRFSLSTMESGDQTQAIRSVWTVLLLTELSSLAHTEMFKNTERVKENKAWWYML